MHDGVVLIQIYSARTPDNWASKCGNATCSYLLRNLIYSLNFYLIMIMILKNLYG